MRAGTFAVKRSALRRHVERLALASLPLLGPAACGNHSDATAPDMAVVGVFDDLGCPSVNERCFWLTYVSGATPSDNISYWLGDGGADPCLPCGFEKLNAYCGQCQVVKYACGTAYFCSMDHCSDACGAAGRRPPGLWLPTAKGERLGDRLASMAHLEAASVPAFSQLARELEAHRAPAPLVAGARRALADEIRHASIVGALARRAGGRPLSLEVAPTPLRSLAEIALDNAVEGCVRETAGAVLAEREARLLPDQTLKEAFASIAADERRHADLAWAIDAWAAPRLAPDERRGVDLARAAAIRELSWPRKREESSATARAAESA